jgi:hypothetical protein
LERDDEVDDELLNRLSKARERVHQLINTARRLETHLKSTEKRIVRPEQGIVVSREHEDGDTGGGRTSC